MPMSRQSANCDTFRAIADPTRRAILDLLRAGERSASELAKPFRMTQPSFSQHLRVLREARLVTQRRSGRVRIYRIRPQELKPVVEWIAQYERFWRHKLRALGDYMEKRP
jgi:DNA-binding transcriptional ArsR family regulator